MIPNPDMRSSHSGHGAYPWYTQSLHSATDIEPRPLTMKSDDANRRDHSTPVIRRYMSYKSSPSS